MPDWNRVSIKPCAPSTAAPKLVKQIAHLCFHTTDLDRAVAFYHGVLGLTPAFEFHDENGKRFGIYLAIGARSFLELFVGTPSSPVGTSTYTHLCLEVHDIAAAVAQIEAKGVTMDRGVQEGRDGTRQAWLKDPDGNRIEIFEYTERSAQRAWL